MMYPSPVGNGPPCQGPWGWRGRCLPSCFADRLALVGAPQGLALMTMVWGGCRVDPQEDRLCTPGPGSAYLGGCCL